MKDLLGINLSAQREREGLGRRYLQLLVFRPGMGSQQGQRPNLGATFYPGGVDDFYMPEVISPAPQRYAWF